MWKNKGYMNNSAEDNGEGRVEEIKDNIKGKKTVEDVSVETRMPFSTTEQEM